MIIEIFGKKNRKKNNNLKSLSTVLGVDKIVGRAVFVFLLFFIFYYFLVYKKDVEEEEEEEKIDCSEIEAQNLELVDKVKDIIVEYLDAVYGYANKNEINIDSSFKGDLNFDDLDIVALVVARSDYKDRAARDAE